jgi:2-hydroxychromene-2-carboxylate isomerase
MSRRIEPIIGPSRIERERYTEDRLVEVAMTLHVDLFWSFRSPYCYLAGGRLTRLREAYDVTVSLRPVLPLVFRFPDYMPSLPKPYGVYFERDVVRVADYLGEPLIGPDGDPDPVAMDPATGKAQPDQPYIYRLTRLGVAAERQGGGLAFARAVSCLIFGRDGRGWDRDDRLAKALAEAGFDLAAMDRAVADGAASLDADIAANGRALEAAGHWGTPTMVFEGEPFFGQDRIDLLIWRMKQRGLQVRG